MIRANVFRSALVLWVLAPLLCWLSLYRPFTESHGRAAALPLAIGDWQQAQVFAMTPRQFELLGTDDATWREYRDPAGRSVFLVAVFHAENWKSVHPPHICIEGSNMGIVADQLRSVTGGGSGAFDVGRILAHSRSEDRDYLSLYAYGGRDLLTGSYAAFVWHCLPAAILRRDTPGFLLRVETWIDADGVDAAEQRCARFLDAVIPVARAQLDKE